MRKGRSLNLINKVLASVSTINQPHSTSSSYEDKNEALQCHHSPVITPEDNGNNEMEPLVSTGIDTAPSTSLNITSSSTTTDWNRQSMQEYASCSTYNTASANTVARCTETHTTSSDSCSGSSSTSASDFDSDDSVFDKDYVPPQTTNNRPRLTDSDSDSIIENSQVNHVQISESPEQDSSELGRQNHQPDEISVDLTKKGTVRKRKHYNIALNERKRLRKIAKNNTRYGVKSGCDENCKKKCSLNISQNQRELINMQYRNYNFKEQYIFISGNTSQTQPMRRTRKNPDAKKIDRGKTVTYFLRKEDGEKVSVCKIFFLTTLGFNRKNDKVVRNALQKSQCEDFADRRGTNPNSKKIDNQRIIEHIHSFHPSLSHYRREHAPHRKYLPSDINVRDMHKDFYEKMGIRENSPSSESVSYDHYRRVVKQQNISFAKLGNEECETCETYKLHNPNSEIRHRNCTECKQYEIHHSRYVLAREKYHEDKVLQMNNKDPNCNAMYYSVDLEKVIMCPRLDEFKVAIFCPRLILFNESFVPLGDKNLCGRSDTFACIWHEAISGRKKDDITSCFRAFFMHYRDLKYITLWMDNCAAQNKNWSLFSYLIFLVNSGESNLETITLKYLEVGHTFMSADEFHHQVELSLKRKGKVYDFEDFHRAVTSTRRNLTVKSMDVNDFFKFEDCSSSYKLQNVTPRALMSNMCQVTFQKGCKTLTYRTDFNGVDIVLDFLRMKNVKIGIPSPVLKGQYRGIKEDRKSEIINKLVPLMPENRKAFWYNLPCNETSVNLLNEYDE